MIQRIQTLFLLISGVLMALMPFVDLTKVITPEMMYTMDGMGFSDSLGELSQPTWILFALGAAVALLSFVAIFMYKNRVAQARVTMFNLILKLGYLVLVVLIARQFTHNHPGASMHVTIWLALPAIAAIFDYLAHRNIMVDERLVRTMDRLRG